MPAAVEALYIRQSSTRTDPEPIHTVYHIEVHLAGPSKRSYTIFKRYSQFTELDAELEAETKVKPIAQLPPKHAWSFRGSTMKNENLIAKRKAGLELYLRTLLSCKDSTWRDAHCFTKFLEVPLTKNLGSDYTLSSWLDEHAALSELSKEVRADLAKRDSLGGMGSDARKASVDAKTKMASLVASLSRLTKGLDELAKAGSLSEGELRRRADLISRLQDEVETSSKIASSTPQRTIQNRSTATRQPEQDPATSAARNDLLGSVKPTGRVLGSAARRTINAIPEETEITRPLDNLGLLQLQQDSLKDQDDRLSAISSVLRRQKALGDEIHNELVGQNEILDMLDQEVDATGRKLNKASDKMKKLR